MDIKKIILDIVFPIRCISCDDYGDWICPRCLLKIKILSDQTCPLCKRIFTENGAPCFACKKDTALDGVLIASFYKEKKQKTLLAKMIHFYKYRFIPELGQSLGKVLEKSIIQSTLPLPDVILPVPLHPRRLRWRGFNQSLIMADYLGQNLTPSLIIPVSDKIVLRNRYTPPQMHIKNKIERTKNVKDAFIINQIEFDNLSLKDKIIYLIDDVATTGSTLSECAKILKRNKVKKVYAVVLARQ